MDLRPLGLSLLASLGILCAHAAPQAIPSLDELAGTWQNAAQVRSLPALNNALGSAQALRDVLAVGKLSFPPLTMAGDTGALTIDGRKPLLTETRWLPYEVQRRGLAGDIAVETAVRMPYEQKGVLFHIVVTNRGAHPDSIRVGITISANTARYPHWAWSVPHHPAAGSYAAEGTGGDTLVTWRAATGSLGNAFGFARAPDELLVGANSANAAWRVELAPGAGASIDYVLAVGDDDAQARTLASRWAADFPATFGQVPREWRARFDAMFTPGNPYFSGHLPVLVTPDAKMRRMYYMGAMTLLCVLRTGFPVAPRVYVSNTPESNCTMMYFWDTRESATTLALLDPAILKNCLRSWLAKGIYNGYAEEYLTGSLQGPWYSANDYSVFVLLNDYLNVTGDRAFLSERVGERTVLEHMDAIATNWKRLVRPGRTLADYGKASNLLECVPTYINEVPSFNAADVWMMRRTAAIEEAQGNRARAAELRADAARLEPAVLALYVPGQGVWRALHEDGSSIEVRHVFDFATVGLTIGRDLPAAMRRDMTAFVERELLTDHWMRAQSLSDPAASVSDRPDHGPMGAFCAWPAETMAAMGEFGEFGAALDFLHRCEAVTYEGPFSQSRELMDRTFHAPVRIAERGAGGRPTQTFNASNGGSFTETILRDFFGYEPDFLQPGVFPDERPRGFSGRLIGVEEGGRAFELRSTEKGIEVRPTGGAADEVDPFIGTTLADARANDSGFYNGNTFPGAAYPMGMVQWSPDTPGRKGVFGGYWYPDRVITGFPLTHFSGRGMRYLQDFPILPIAGPIAASPGTHWTDYAAHFSPDGEQAHPGYYSVELDSGIRVQLSVTARTGLARIRFPAGSPRTLLVRTDSHAQIVGNDEIDGWHATAIAGGKQPFTLYVVARCNRPFTAAGAWSGDDAGTGKRTADGRQSGAWVSLGDSGSDEVELKVGLSFVSLDGARRNLEAENPDWDFDSVRIHATDAWNQELNRVAIGGGSRDDRRKFYTALYHCFFHPNLLNDADGQYPGMDGKIHTVAAGRSQDQNIPAWDQYRSFAALRSILTPRAMSDIAQSLANYARQDAAARPDGGGLPRWEQANRNSGGMAGDGDDAIIATAYAYGARDFDAPGALAAMEKGASVPGTTSDGVAVRQGLADYLAKGYVPRRASVTLEYCANDFALAQFARALGHPQDAAQFERRSRAWRTLYNPATGYLEPREPDGSFPADFSPAASRGFTEGSASQYLWMVNFDFPGLIQTLGGNQAVVARLDRFFTKLDEPGRSEFAFMGNEPCEAAPWTYDFAGAPSRAQAVVRRIQRELFHEQPGGLPGNDDAGAISSWYVFSALGLYPAVPGVAGLAVGSPQFPRATIDLGDGHVLRIEGEGAAPDAPYLQSLAIDGKPWNRPWIPWDKLEHGADLKFVLGSEPTSWGQ